MSSTFFENHSATLEQALQAIGARGYWSPYSESPSPRIYGENAAEAGKAAFDARLNRPFEIDQAGTIGRTGKEISPYGPALGISYPQADLDQLLAGVSAASTDWRRAGPEVWTGVALEIVKRLNAHSFEIAHAVMHTTGQAYMMAFQAGGPHAQDRAVEAIAYAWQETSRIPARADWEKPQGKHDPLKMQKSFRIVPRGIGLVIGCCTFPTWNSYPGLFADLASGNAVIVKPHPGAILPLAITVEIARAVIAEAGYHLDIVTLVAHETGDRTATDLALRPQIKLIDFTGSAANGNWLERHAVQAQVFTEKSGVNQIVIDSTADFQGMARNIAFSLVLYSGQMCTTPQNIYIPKDGIDTAEGHVSFDGVVAAISDAIDKLTGDPAKAVELLGAIQNTAVLERIEAARAVGQVVLDSKRLPHPQFPEARICTPLLVKAADGQAVTEEFFGPIAFVIGTDNTARSIALAEQTVCHHGALSLSGYSTNAAVKEALGEAAANAGVALSLNLTGAVLVNQSAAFSDYHGTGANPAANAALTETAFVASRFRVVQTREPV
jgi:phenylacetic acid degradation protein paaN